MKPQKLIELENENQFLTEQLAKPVAQLTLDPQYNWANIGTPYWLVTEEMEIPEGTWTTPAFQRYSYTTEAQSDFFIFKITGMVWNGGTGRITNPPIFINFFAEADNRWFIGNNVYMQIESLLNTAEYPFTLPYPKGVPQQSRLVIDIKSYTPNFSAEGDFMQIAFWCAKRRARRYLPRGYYE